MRKNNETKQHTNVVLLFFVTLIVFLMLSPISSVTAHAAKNTVSIGKTGQSVYITFSLEKSSQIDHYYITISDNYGTYITSFTRSGSVNSNFTRVVKLSKLKKLVDIIPLKQL